MTSFGCLGVLTIETSSFSRPHLPGSDVSGYLPSGTVKGGVCFLRRGVPLSCGLPMHAPGLLVTNLCHTAWTGYLVLLVMLDVHGHGADAEPLGRQAAFFGAVHALALRLRSVFVPYYRYVMDGAMAHLSSAAAAAEAQPKKKRKKSSLPAADMPSNADDPTGLRWVVRHRVRTLQSQMHDSGSLDCIEEQASVAPVL